MSEARQEFAGLPRVSEIEDVKIRQRVTALLELLDQTVTEKDRLEAIENDCKDELEQLQTAAGKAGFRCGLLCFQAVQAKGRKTINSEKVQGLLLEYGFPPAQMYEIWKEGEPSVRRTFKRLPEEQ